MAYVQPNFTKFHDKIRLSDSNANAKLREKREIIVEALRAGLNKHADDGGKNLTFSHFNQGSYAIGTGILPKDGDYDIDVGIIFDNSADDFEHAVKLKKIVRDAVQTYGRNVKIRRPCVTVTYLKDGKTDYHVDLAIYVETDSDDLNLAVGRESSSDDQIYWELSDPKGLTKKINDLHSGDDAKQFRRCVRYLKKWRDYKFSGSGAPVSIGLTCAAYAHFVPTKYDSEYSDLRATKSLVSSMLTESDSGAGRIVAKLPVRPWNDLFDEMTDTQMNTFVEKLRALEDALEDAREETSVKEACKTLNGQFGPDFEVPDDNPGKKSGPRGTAKTSAAAPFVPTGSSAR